MKRLILVAALLTGSASTWAHEHGHAQPAAAKSAEAAVAGKTYGAPMPKLERSVSIADAASRPEAHTGGPLLFSGRITQVCQEEGCWMVLEHDGAIARVFMHGHSFTVPKDASGEAKVYGTLSVKNLSADEIAHLRKEGSNATARELHIDATSVQIGES